MKKEVFYGSNKEGVPTIPRSKALKEAMLAFGDAPYQLVLEKRVKVRSNQQNKYYNGCLIPAVIDGLVDNGYPRSELNRDVVHDMLRNKFLLTELVSEQTGEVIQVVRSTSEISTTDFMVFVDDIIRWAATYLHCVISLPNEQSMMNFNEDEL